MVKQAEVRPETPDDRWQADQMLASLLVGAARFERGERLAGHRAVFADALPRLVGLLARHTPGAASGADPYDPFRRFEALRPELGAALDATLGLPASAAALALLDLAERCLVNTPAAPSTAAILAVRQRLKAHVNRS